MLVEFTYFNMTMNLEALKNYILKTIIRVVVFLKNILSVGAKLLLTQFPVSLCIFRWGLKISQFRFKSKPESSHHKWLLTNLHTRNCCLCFSASSSCENIFHPDIWRNRFKLVSNCALCFCLLMYISGMPWCFMREESFK